MDATAATVNRRSNLCSFVSSCAVRSLFRIELPAPSNVFRAAGQARDSMHAANSGALAAPAPPYGPTELARCAKPHRPIDRSAANPVSTANLEFPNCFHVRLQIHKNNRMLIPHGTGKRFSYGCRKFFMGRLTSADHAVSCPER